jgi:uncharacterized protein YwqG
MEDLFQIGSLTFTDVNWNFAIAKMTHEFYFECKAKVHKPIQGIKEELLSDYHDGEISLNFSCLGIHNKKIPTGVFEIEEDKTNDPYFYLRREGFHYSLGFYGTISFDNGWMMCDGQLKNNYNEKPIFPVKIRQQFDYHSLDWKNYHFSSLEETEGLNANLIQYLYLGKNEYVEIPEQVFLFKNLKALTIGSHYDYYSNKVGAIKSISEKIGELVKLEDLTIINTAITSLPESIGKLKNLKTLNVMNCKLLSLPQSLFSLPKLTYIFADNNEIEYLDDTLNLPNLISISLEKNKLKTLPESLGRLPKLKSIKVDENPFERLPEIFNVVKGLELNINDKRRLLDYQYRGADGKGLIEWDDTLFYTKSDSTILSQAREIIKRNKLLNFEKELLSLAKKSVGYNQIEKEDYTKVGNSRFGGMPDLPLSIVYPKFKYDYDKKTYKYEFIAQINCEEVSPFQDYLPREGMLYFFLSSLHFIGMEESFKIAIVLYHEGGEDLISGKKIKTKNQDYYEMIGDGCYQGYHVSAKECTSFPSFYSFMTNTYIFKSRADGLLNSLEASTNFQEVIHDQFEDPISNIDKNDHEINGYIFTQHESPELQAALSKKGDPQDWINLLKVSSQGDFQWGDAGDLAFVIHKSDLLQKDFSNVFCMTESS